MPIFAIASAGVCVVLLLPDIADFALRSLFPPASPGASRYIMCMLQNEANAILVTHVISCSQLTVVIVPQHPTSRPRTCHASRLLQFHLLVIRVVHRMASCAVYCCVLVVASTL